MRDVESRTTNTNEDRHGTMTAEESYQLPLKNKYLEPASKSRRAVSEIALQWRRSASKTKTKNETKVMLVGGVVSVLLSFHC